MPPKQGGFPVWGWILIGLGVILFSGFAGCAACVYMVGKEPAPGCNASRDHCRECCSNQGKRGGYLEQRRTRMNGARYTVCVCE